jgi:hypothetical protein
VKWTVKGKSVEVMVGEEGGGVVIVVRRVR